MPEWEWRQLDARRERLERERQKQEHRERLRQAEEAATRRITHKIRRREVRQEGIRGRQRKSREIETGGCKGREKGDG